MIRNLVLILLMQVLTVELYSQCRFARYEIDSIYQDTLVQTKPNEMWYELTGSHISLNVSRINQVYTVTMFMRATAGVNIVKNYGLEFIFEDGSKVYAISMDSKLSSYYGLALWDIEIDYRIARVYIEELAKKRVRYLRITTQSGAIERPVSKYESTEFQKTIQCLTD